MALSRSKHYRTELSSRVGLHGIASFPDLLYLQFLTALLKFNDTALHTW